MHPLWIAFPLAAGIAAPLIFRSRPLLASAVIILAPPFLLCLYFVRSVVGDGWGAIGLALISLGWTFLALVGAGYTLIWIDLSKPLPGGSRPDQGTSAGPARNDDEGKS